VNLKQHAHFFLSEKMNVLNLFQDYTARIYSCTHGDGIPRKDYLQLKSLNLPVSVFLADKYHEAKLYRVSDYWG
jgi:hypothetical protein